MKKTVVLAVFAACSIANANATNIYDGVYASMKAGISDTKYKNSSNLFIDQDILFTNSSEKESIYPTISAAIGYDFSAISPVSARAELEYTYKKSKTFTPNVTNQIDTVTGGTAINPPENVFNNELTSQSLMLNGYYDFKNESKFTPYITAGIGFTHLKNKQSFVDSNSTSGSDSDNHFTWATGVGVAYAVTKNVDLDLSYRYVDAGKFKFENTVDGELARTDAKLTSNEYLLGVRYMF